MDGNGDSEGEFYLPPSHRGRGFWEPLQALLSGTPPKTNADLAGLMRRCHEHIYGKLDAGQFLNLGGLVSAIEYMEENVKGFHFLEGILPKIMQWAREPSGIKKMPILCAGKSASCSLSTAQARHLLSLAFFLALPDGDEEGRLGSLAFHRIYASKQIGAERTKCLLNYFFHEARGTYPEETVTFERRALPRQVDWSASKTQLSDAKFSHEHRIEDMEADADAIVDFANKRLQIFCMINSCTQEEVMFSCRPALKLSMLVCEMLKDDEVAILRGARAYSDYTGYLQTFRFKGDSEHLERYRQEAKEEKHGPEKVEGLDKAGEKEGKASKNDDKKDGGAEADNKKLQGPSKASDVIAIDAMVNHGYYQFRPTMLQRDLNKAWLGFGGGFQTERTLGRISTGMWGCGVFNGDPLLKFLQQLMAASEVKRPLNFSTFGNKGNEEKFRSIHAQLQSKKVEVGKLYRCLLSYSTYLKNTEGRGKSLEAFILEELKLKS